MTLRERQSLFARLLAKLISEAFDRGYEVTLGEAWRTPEMASIYAKNGKGTLSSLHISRLAVDLNLYKDGKWLTRTEDHTELGIFWKSLHPDCRWGGDFKTRPDGNHYSMTPDGGKTA